MGKQNFNSKGKRGSSRGGATNNAKTKRFKSKRDDTKCEQSEDRSDARARGANDISWYTKYPELLSAAANIPFPYRPGMKLPAYAGNSINSTTIPGVFIIKWMPYLGSSDKSTDPASIVAKEIYAKVRSSFSGSLDADAPDYVMYLAALSSIFSYIGSLKRIFRLLNAYGPNNYIMPDAVLWALGIDEAAATNMRLNKDRFWQNINTLVYMSRKFTCPAVMDFFNRHYWLSDNVYTDANTMNSQFYVFLMDSLYEYSEQDTPDGVSASGLSVVSCNPYGIIQGATEVDPDVALFNYGKALIEDLVAWDESYTISGYLQRAYEGTPNFVLDTIGYDEIVTPIYNEEVLTQIENARPATNLSDGGRIDVGGWNVSQDPKTNTVIVPDRIITKTPPAAVSQLTGLYPDPIINIRSDVPTAGDVVIATRLKNDTEFVPSTVNENTYDVRVIAGSEIVLSLEVVPSLGSVQVFTGPVKFEANATTSSLMGVLSALAWVAQFDWHPEIDVAFRGAGPNYEVLGINRMIDLHNATAITPEALENIHRVCLYSEFNAFRY